jgi:hypothetical protein
MRNEKKPITIFLKWLGTILNIAGVTLSAAHVFPAGPIILVFNSWVWVGVGCLWGEKTIWIPNGFSGIFGLYLLLHSMHLI